MQADFERRAEAAPEIPEELICEARGLPPRRGRRELPHPLKEGQHVTERLSAARGCDAYQVAAKQARWPAAPLDCRRRRQAAIGEEGLQPLR